MSEEIIIDEEYEFQVEQATIPDYRMCGQISQWIYNNLKNLTDDDDHKLFNKVNYGFNEESLNTFGKKSVADVYVDSIDYDSDLQYSRPVSAHSIIIFYVKGSIDVSYMKTCQVHDYIMQQFIENDDWKELTGVVRNTVVTNSQVMNQPIQKKWGVMGAFELRHDLY
jgi:hypothetical protein